MALLETELIFQSPIFHFHGGKRVRIMNHKGLGREGRALVFQQKNVSVIFGVSKDESNPREMWRHPLEGIPRGSSALNLVRSCLIQYRYT